MAVSLTRLPYWLWRVKDKEPPITTASSLNSTTEWNLNSREPENVNFPKVRGKISTSSRKVRRKWHSREERTMRRIDKEYDVVLVPSDGVGLSGSESDSSDWSVGWLEPHGPDFQSDDDDDDTDDSFAVLVPCYSPGCKEVVENSNNHFLSATKNLGNENSVDCKIYMEKWLSSLQDI